MADIRVRDMAERLVWTFVQSFLAALTLEALVLDTGTLHAAFLAALLATVTTLIGWLTLIARHRLDVLPDPGEMFAPERARSMRRHPSNPGE